MQLFNEFSPIVHIKTTENADGNGGFRKRFHIEVEPFENASFVGWIGENGAEKKRHYTVASIKVLLWRKTHQNVCVNCFQMKTH